MKLRRPGGTPKTPGDNGGGQNEPELYVFCAPMPFQPAWPIIVSNGKFLEGYSERIGYLAYPLVAWVYYRAN